MKLQELFDVKSAFKLEWDEQFAAQGEVHAETRDARGRRIHISFTPVGLGNNATEVVFSRGDSYDMTGGGDAGRVLATVIQALDQYITKYRPTHIVFSSQGASRTGVYSAIARRLSRGYTALTPDQFPWELEEWASTLGSATPFVFRRADAVKAPVAEDGELAELSYTDPGIAQHMTSLGYRAAGAGKDQTTWIAPDGSVVKIFGTQRGQKGWTQDHRMFATWVQYCRKHAGNPYIPKFGGWRSFEFPEGSGQKYLQIKMERLTPIRDATLRAVLEQFDHAVENGRSFASLESVGVISIPVCSFPTQKLSCCIDS